METRGFSVTQAIQFKTKRKLNVLFSFNLIKICLCLEFN